jgi:Bacterial TniB protein
LVENMSQIELASVPDPSVPKHSANRQSPQLWQQPIRSPEIQAEVERIGAFDPYVAVGRDTALFTCLNNWRDRRTCGRIMTVDRLGLGQALDYYTREQTKRRGNIIRIPAPIAYIEIDDPGNGKSVFLSILSFLANPINCGGLRDLRFRTWETIKKCGVKILIVNYADLLLFSGLNELMRIAEKCQISVVLAGTGRIDEILNPKTRKRYLQIHNTFLNYHQLSVLSSSETETVVNSWETKLGWARPMNLARDITIPRTLHDLSQGQICPLYDRLKQIAIWHLDNPHIEINANNISNLLINAQAPQVGLG